MKVWKTLNDVDLPTFKSVRCDTCYKEFYVEDIKLPDIIDEKYCPFCNPKKEPISSEYNPVTMSTCVSSVASPTLVITDNDRYNYEYTTSGASVKLSEQYMFLKDSLESKYGKKKYKEQLDRLGKSIGITEEPDGEVTLKRKVIHTWGGEYL